jgi:DNA topoisomerase-1
MPTPVAERYLVILESPSKIHTIEGFLGHQYKCVATLGHFRVLKNLKSIKTRSNFEPTYELDEAKAKHIKELKYIIDSYKKSNVIIGTDCDAEGEAIGWHICMHFGLPVETTKRIQFREITQPALLAAIARPTVIDMNLVFSQQSRQILDLIVGFKVSPFLWKHLYSNPSHSLSAGRCQTPALRLIYDNEMAKDTVIESHYVTKGLFFERLDEFIMDHTFLSAEEAKAYLEFVKAYTGTWQIVIGNPRLATHEPPKPFTTSTILQVSPFSPKTTMKLCQDLYQKGHITYMRTANPRYSAVFLNEAKDFIETNYCANTVSQDLVELTTTNENPHEAIRVTHLGRTHIGDSYNATDPLEKMYQLVRRNTIESCMAPATYEVTKVEISPKNQVDWPYVFSSVIETPVNLGFKRYTVSGSLETKMQVDTRGQLMYYRSLLSVGPPKVVECKATYTKPSKHYTESSLIATLERMGIGKPSTFASLVEVIQERGYVTKKDIQGVKVSCVDLKLYISPKGDKPIEVTERETTVGSEKNKLVITPIGILALQFLLQYFEPLFAYSYTSDMESALDTCFSGALTMQSLNQLATSRETICSTCYSLIKRLSEPLIEEGKRKTYDIGEGWTLFFNKTGASLRHLNEEDGTYEYKNVSPLIQLDLERLERGEYTLEELVEETQLGEIEGLPVSLKMGKYGLYALWNDLRFTLKGVKEPTLDIVEPMIRERTRQSESEVIEDPSTALRERPTGGKYAKYNPNILRVINTTMSVRKNAKTGKPYIFYQREDMKKPLFFPLGKYANTYETCDQQAFSHWVHETYLR